MEPTDQNAQFNELLALTSDWYWEQDATFHYTFLSERYYALTGLTPADIVGTTRWAHKTLNMDAGDWARHRAVLEAHQRFLDLELCYPTPNGGVRWCSVSGMPLFGADGKFSGYRGLARDISAEMLARDVLREKEAELHRVLDSVPVMICRMDRNRRYVYANRRYAAYYGLEPRDIVGRTSSEILGEERSNAIVSHVHRALGGEEVHYTHLSVDRAGRGRHFEIRVVPDRSADGAVQGYYALMSEFTETALAQTAIRNKERELRHLLDSVPALVAHVGADNRYTYANNLFAAAYGMERDAIVGRAPNDLVDAETAVSFNGFRERLLAGETVAYERELRGAHGTRRRYQLHLIPEFDPAGAICGSYVFGIDITEHKAQERRAAALLTRLSEANRELESFAYTVSHDLRAPLRAIGGYAEILVRDAGVSMAAPAQAQLHRISSNAVRMSELIDGLLRLSQLARQAVDKRNVFPEKLVAEVIADHESDIATRGIRISLGALPECTADPVLLKQVFANLLGNAFKYTEKRANAEIEVGARTVDGKTVYFVKDNGAGFDMAYADKLFGVFQRLHGENEFPGTGIGLATVKRIVERHDGRVWGESIEGEGAGFYFTLGT